MRNVRLASLFLAISVLIIVSVLFASCGGGGGTSGGGVSVDNSKAIGTFTYFTMDGHGGGFYTDYGTVTFDGQGNGSHASLVIADSGTFTYTVTVPGNMITIDNSMIGTLNQAGNFLTAVDISGTNMTIISAVKSSASFTDTSVTYVGGQFRHDTTSSAALLSITTATPSAGLLSYTDLTSATTGTIDYTLASNGTFSVPSTNSDTFGAITADKNIILFGDAETIINTEKSTACGLRLPGSGMNASKLNGTYKVYEFRDDAASSVTSSFAASRSTVTFDGAGNGTHTTDATSSGPLGTDSFTYTMASDGKFVIVGSQMKGVALADGSVVCILDDSPAGDNSVSAVIGIKQ